MPGIDSIPGILVISGAIVCVGADGEALAGEGLLLALGVDPVA